MVLVIGASSLRAALDKLPYKQRKNLSIRTRSINSLTLNPKSRSKSKNLQWLLRHGCLKRERDIIIWHDIINNSITTHSSNSQTKLTPEQLVTVLQEFQPQIAGIIYLRRVGTPFIFESLRKLDTLVVDALAKLISKQRQKSLDFVLDDSQEHINPKTEIHLLKKSPQSEKRSKDSCASTAVNYPSRSHQRAELSTEDEIKRVTFER